MKFMQVTMANNNWMTSAGLDIDANTFTEPKSIITVEWGNLLGEFISYNSKNNTLAMKVTEKKGVFLAIQNAPLQAKILFAEEIYIITWISYNYTISNVLNGLIISIEEIQDEQQKTIGV